MSKTAEWVYTNVATVYPKDWVDDREGITDFGVPYLIACTWEDNQETANDSTGTEFLTKSIFYTESKHHGAYVRLPVRGDFIRKGDTRYEGDPVDAEGDEVRAVKDWDMSFFGEDPDYKILT
jgi:hypothetical protein